MSDFALPTGVVADVEKDSLGGGVVPSNIYAGKLKLVYMDQSASGAKCVNIHFETAAGQLVRQTVYISNKAGEYVYNKDGKSFPLPGYSQMNAFFEAVTGKGIADQDVQEKTIKIYVHKDGGGSEQNVERDVFMDCDQLACAAGILHISDEKTVANGKTDAKGKPEYEGTGEFREINEFSKWFDAQGFTTTERAGELADPVFAQDWKKKYKDGVTIRKAKIQGANSGAVAGAPAAAAAPKKSLFA